MLKGNFSHMTVGSLQGRTACRYFPSRRLWRLVSHMTFCTVRYQTVVHMKTAIFHVVLVDAFVKNRLAVSSADGGASRFDGQVVLEITFPFVCGSVGIRSPVTQLGTQLRRHLNKSPFGRRHWTGFLTFEGHQPQNWTNHWEA